MDHRIATRGWLVPGDSDSLLATCGWLAGFLEVVTATRGPCLFRDRSSRTIFREIGLTTFAEVGCTIFREVGPGVQG